jgi:hypothetical protein
MADISSPRFITVRGAPPEVRESSQLTAERVLPKGRHVRQSDCPASIRAPTLKRAGAACVGKHPSAAGVRPRAPADRLPPRADASGSGVFGHRPHIPSFSPVPAGLGVRRLAYRPRRPSWISRGRGSPSRAADHLPDLSARPLSCVVGSARDRDRVRRTLPLTGDQRLAGSLRSHSVFASMTESRRRRSSILAAHLAQIRECGQIVDGRSGRTTASHRGSRKPPRAASLAGVRHRNTDTTQTYAHVSVTDHQAD